MNARSLAPETLAHLESWIGKTETAQDLVQPSAIARWLATLDHAPAMLKPDAGIWPLSHWLFFLPQHLQSESGEDGHAQTGGFLPPVPFPRRMWAGSRLSWQVCNPILQGQAIQRLSRIESIQHKSGRSGDLLFVNVSHTISNEAGVAITEHQDLVYRPMPLPDAPSPAPTLANTQAAWQRVVTPTPALLFRYSGLTFNAHRIHYDEPYATQVEGYPGLVVHGPLIATLLIDLVKRHAPDARIASYSFKAIRPTFHTHPFTLCGQPSADGQSIELWSHDHEGFLTMQASVQLA